MSASRAIAATPHGNALPTPDGRSPLIAPAGAPHRWQNFAPGVSGARQLPHTAPARGAPQLAQNFPVADAPQDGHATVPPDDDGEGGGPGVVMGVEI